MPRALNLQVMPDRYAACLIDPNAAFALSPASDDALTVLVDAPGERTLICPEDRIPGSALDSQPDWRALRLVEDTAFDEPGILVSITRPISAAGIGILCFSTYTADLVLVQAHDLDTAVAALTAEGHVVKEQEPRP